MLLGLSRRALFSSGNQTSRRKRVKRMDVCHINRTIGEREAPVGTRFDLRRHSALLTANDWPLWSAVVGSAALGQVGTRLIQSRRVEGIDEEPLLVMLCGFLASFFDILPVNCPAYAMIWEWIVPLAAVLYLLESDFTSSIKASRWVVPMFCIGATGTVLGTFVAWIAVGPFLGPEGWKIAAALCATYIGGSTNLASTATALKLSTGPLLTAVVATDNLALMAYLSSISLVRVDKARHRLEEIPERIGNISTAVYDLVGVAQEGRGNENGWTQEIPLSGIFLGILCCACGNSMAALINFPEFGMAFMALLASGLALVLNKKTGPSLAKGCRAAGSSLMAVFFVVIGASCGSLGSVFHSMPMLPVFVVIQISVHLLFVLFCGRRLGVSLKHILTASNATIGGPGTAAGMAAAKGWTQMVQPAVFLGCLGYSVATFIGICISYVLRSTL